MHRDRFPVCALRSLGVAAALLFPAGTGEAAMLPAHRFVGTYTVTQVGGAGVQHMELQLQSDGHASLRTDFSRYTQRPVASAPIPPVLENGTWRAQRNRAIVHILSTSDDDASAPAAQRPQYSDLTFVLSGCMLRLVTTEAQHRELEFSKKHCVPPS